MRKLVFLPACLAAVALAAAVSVAGPDFALLPGEEVPGRILPGPGPAPTAPGYGLLPGEEVPQEVYVQQAEQDMLDWGVAKMAAPECWKMTKGKGVKVAVLDTGCDPYHPDLESAVGASKDFTGSKAGTADVNGHGTHCCGVVGARLNGQGVAGMAPECVLLVGKVLGDTGGGTDLGIAQGIDWSVAQGADVISMSLGAAAPSQRIHDAVRRAVAAGVIVVAAAGNSGPNEGTVGYPGAFAECVCVGATDQADAAANFSSRGPALWIAAPGVRIRSCFPGGRFAEMSGTSMATPHVAGAAALWCSTHPDGRAERPAKFRADLAKHAKDLGAVGRDTTYGHGLMRVLPMLPAVVVPPPPPPGNGLVLTEADLTPEARARLEAAYPGGKWRLELPGLVPVLPLPKEKQP